MDSRKYIFDEFDSPPVYNAGQWYQHTTNFSIDLNDQDQADNDWFSITGQQLGNSDPKHYVYFDDVRLFRPCDVMLRCTKAHGQICPTITTQQWPNNPITVRDISNASDIHLKIYNNPAQPVYDQTFHNGNGLPDFHLSRFALGYPATAIYQYDLEISNACGGFKQTGNIQVFDTALYNASPIWVDSTANWTVTPIPCCLNALVLQNMQIVGDVSYIVRDQITVQSGVSVAPGSNVIIQAGNVVELDSVEFDGTSSSVEILEIPCPNRMAGEGGCCAEGNMMVINAGVIQAPSDSLYPQPQLVSASVEDSESGEILHRFGLWAYPNPVHENLSLGFSLDRTFNCNLHAYDINMRPTLTLLESQSFKEGDHVIHVDVADLPAGIYFVQLIAEGNTASVRVVKQ